MRGCPLDIVCALGMVFVASCDENVITHDLAAFLDDIGEAPPFANFHIFEDINSFCVASCSWHFHLPEAGMEDKPGRSFAQIRERYGRGGSSRQN